MFSVKYEQQVNVQDLVQLSEIEKGASSHILFQKMQIICHKHFH